MGHSVILEVLNKRKSTSPNVSRNIQKFDASIDENLANDEYSASIFSKVIGQELSDSLSADIYLLCWVEFISNIVENKARNFVHWVIQAVNTSDEFNTFCNRATRAKRPMDGSH